MQAKLVQDIEQQNRKAQNQFLNVFSSRLQKENSKILTLQTKDATEGKELGRAEQVQLANAVKRQGMLTGVVDALQKNIVDNPNAAVPEALNQLDQLLASGRFEESEITLLKNEIEKLRGASVDKLSELIFLFRS